MAATRSGVPLAMENVFVAQRRSCVSSDASRQFGIDEGQYLLAGRDQPFVTTWLHMQALLGDEPRHILDVDDPLVRVALEQWARGTWPTGGTSTTTWPMRLSAWPCACSLSPQAARR